MTIDYKEVTDSLDAMAVFMDAALNSMQGNEGAVLVHFAKRVQIVGDIINNYDWENADDAKAEEYLNALVEFKGIQTICKNFKDSNDKT